MRESKHEFETVLFSLKDKIKKVKKAEELYCALSNMRWQKITNPSIIYSCSWRYAGRLIADIREKGEDYLDFYCSGCYRYDIHEGEVKEWIEKILMEKGWKPLPWD